MPIYDTYNNNDKILSFLHIFISALHSNADNSSLSALIKELSHLKRDDIESIQSTKDGEVLLVEIATLLRGRFYNLLSAGHICGVEYFYILLFVSPSSEVYVAKDNRFEPFVLLAQEGLFADGNSDVENLLYIELYIIAKALCSFCDLTSLIREYMSLIILVDINLPISLAHTQFIVTFFENLGIDMTTLLDALKAQLAHDTYLSYPPLARRSILNWQIHCFWNVPCFFNHPLWLELYPLWRDIFYTLLCVKSENDGGNNAEIEIPSIENLDEAMYLQFFIYHMCGNNFQHQAQWRRFCKEIDSVAVHVYEAFAHKNGIYGNFTSKKPDGAKKCIGFLRDRLVANSPYKVEYSLLHCLLNNAAFSSQYEVKIYTMKLLEKSSDDESIIRAYEELGVKVVDVVSSFNSKGFYNSHLSKALALKDALNRDNVEILISPNNGYGISDFILATRSAPLQIYYSHGNFVYDLPCIDVKMTHICQNKRHINHEGYDFCGVPVKMLDRFYNPPLDTESKERVSSLRDTFPKDSIILGTIGRLVKLHSKEYWACVVAIMRDFPQSIYLACGGGNSAFISECIMSVCSTHKEGEAMLKRVHFTGYIDSSLYGHIIDIWLDSFPLEQGESRIEYAAKGGLNITMSKQSRQKRTENLSALIAQWRLISPSNPKTQAQCDEALEVLDYGHLSLIAFSLDDYTQKAKDLVALYAAHDTDSINALKRTIAQGRAIGDEIRANECVAAFMDIMRLNSTSLG